MYCGKCHLLGARTLGVSLLYCISAESYTDAKGRSWPQTGETQERDCRHGSKGQPRITSNICLYLCVCVCV